MIGLIWSLVVGSALCQQFVVEAQLGDDLRQIKGRVKCILSKEDEVHIALYPAALNDLSKLNDVNRQWFYPHGFSRSNMDWRIDGRTIPVEQVWTSLGQFAAGKEHAGHGSNRR